MKWRQAAPSELWVMGRMLNRIGLGALAFVSAAALSYSAMALLYTLAATFR